MNEHLSRRTDPITSALAAEQLTTVQSHCGLLIAVYDRHPDGLTDEEAVTLAGLHCTAHKRCSDLRRQGLISPTGRTRISSRNRSNMICSVVFRETLF